VSVTNDDVRHIAALARLGIAEERLPALVAELNGILAHMQVLQQVKIGDEVEPAEGVGAAGMRLREDDGAPIPLARPLKAFAPAERDGFVIVPRLATHESAAEELE
jgi:aspartyl-tRNA(Asn)/glutamyl-tRNA(Gln) amidotransferase subunit C